MLLTQLIESLPIRLRSGVGGQGEVVVRGLTDDSRTVTPGDLFIARGGCVTDGRRFIADAVARGAVAVLSDQPVTVDGAAALYAEDLGGALVEVARRFHGDPASKLKLIGITGTNGKTTTAYLVRHLLGAAGLRCGLIGTVETDNGRLARASNLTTPGIIELMGLLAEMVRNGCQACVMEVSSHALDQGRARGLSFAAAAFTNLSGDHLDYHKTMDAYAAAKAKLFESLNPCATAVVNAEDAASHGMLRDCRARRLSYGDVPGVDCRMTLHQTTSRGTDCSFDGPWGPLRVRLPLIGRHNVANMAAALCCAHAVGVDVPRLRTGIQNCPQVPGRLERVVSVKPQASRLNPVFDVFVDYAHTDDALANVLRALRPVTRGRLRVMFGCGGDRDATKRPRMAKVACDLADDVTITSDNPRTENPRMIIEQVLAGVPVKMRQAVVVEPDRAAAIERMIDDAGPGDVVLLAGKGHEDYQIIGTEKRPFDDRQVARAAIERRNEESGVRNQESVKTSA